MQEIVINKFLLRRILSVDTLIEIMQPVVEEKCWLKFSENSSL